MNANLKKIEELQAQNEKLASLVDRVIDVTRENSNRIILDERWLMSLTDLVLLLYESRSSDKQKREKANRTIPKVNVMDRIAREIGGFPKV